MPSKEKIRWAQLKVGIVAIIALALVFVLVFLMTGDRAFFSKDVTVYTYLDDAAAIGEGSPVRLNGILVGSIRNVSLSGESARNRIIRVTMGINEKYLPLIPSDSVAAISAENVLGSKYINIKKGQGTSPVEPGGEIASLDTRDFEELVAGGYATLDSLRSILRRIDAIIAEVEVGRGSIGKLLADDELYNQLTGTVAEAHELTEALNRGEGTIGKLIYDDAIYAELRTVIERVDRMIEGIEGGEGTVGRLLKDEALYDDVRATVNELQTLVAELNEGKGTAGKLLKDEELHDRIAAVVDELNATIHNVNTGQGTIGQLMVNPQLYESLNGASFELNEFLKEFRKDPRKFLRIKASIF